MTTKPALLISFLLLGFCLRAQTVSGVYKINDLLNRINQPDTTYVINFWATWCKPCIKELPAFDSLYAETKNTKTKVILVCLDFKEELDKKVNPFLKKNQVQPECVLLDEVNGNDFINRVAPNWSGAIPATLFINKKRQVLYESKMHLGEIKVHLAELPVER